MYCNYCGCEIPSGVAFCPKCGGKIDQNSIVDTDTSVIPQNDVKPMKKAPKAKTNGFAIAGFILSILGVAQIAFALLGTVFSIIALAQINKSDNKNGQSLAIAGIAIGGVFIFTNIFSLIQSSIRREIRREWLSANIPSLTEMIRSLVDLLNTKIFKLLPSIF